MFSNVGIVSTSKQSVLELDLTQFDHLYAINAHGNAACVKDAREEALSARRASLSREKGVDGVVCRHVGTGDPMVSPNASSGKRRPVVSWVAMALTVVIWSCSMSETRENDVRQKFGRLPLLPCFMKTNTVVDVGNVYPLDADYIWRKLMGIEHLLESLGL
ncbi:hypothetical protein L1887_05446 [Cichorium endivia]|nr:hypothetical protein L1887_05446 [Cichorium endivia]